MKKLITLLAVITLLLVSGCSKEEKDPEVTVVKVGVVGEYNEMWDVINEKLKGENIKVELVKFNDYATPNRALNDDEIDMNAFQHHKYLDNEVATYGYDIVAIGDTLFAPLGIYNNKNRISSISDFKDGDIIAIPSDATNGGRAIKLLEEIGLITVDPSVGYMATVSDITEYKVKIDIKEAESATLANLLPDCAAALINAGNAVTAGLNPKDDTIYMEDQSQATDYIKTLANCLVVKTGQKDSEVFRKIVEAYQSEEVAKVFEEVYNNAFFPAW